MWRVLPQYSFVQDATILFKNHSQSNSCKAKHTTYEKQGEGYNYMGYKFLIFAGAFSDLSCLPLSGLSKKTCSF